MCSPVGLVWTELLQYDQECQGNQACSLAHCSGSSQGVTPQATTIAEPWGLNELTLYMLNFSEGMKTLYLHFMPFLHIDMTQVGEIPSQVRQRLTYSTLSISLLLMSWRRKEPGHQQPWYWSSQNEIARSLHVKGVRCCPCHILWG